MVNQIAIASGMIGVCEALLYAQRAGLDVETVLDTIKDGAAGSWSLTNYGPRLLSGDFEPGFKIDHFVKDLGIALAGGSPDAPAAPRDGARRAALRRRRRLRASARKGTQALLATLAQIAGNHD